MIINSVFVGKAKKSAGGMTTSTDGAGRTIARQKPIEVRNPKTEAQTVVRDLFKDSTKYSRNMAPLVAPVIQKKYGYRSAYSELSSRIITELKGGITSVEKLSTKKVRYADGTVLSGNPEVNTGTVELHTSGTVVFDISWDTSTNAISTVNDTLHIIDIDPNTGVGAVVNTGVKRSVGTTTVTRPQPTDGQERIFITYFKNHVTGENSPGYAKLYINYNDYAITNTEVL